MAARQPRLGLSWREELRKLFEITNETAATSRDALIKADEHAAVELSDETLDEVTGAEKLRRAAAMPFTCSFSS
jgi:hypothetical protein